jgi:hypothetical protein
MPQDVPEDYFYRGVFARALPGQLFAKLTCIPCGTRVKTWEAFRAHRRECLGRPAATQGSAAWDAGAGADGQEEGA